MRASRVIMLSASRPFSHLLLALLASLPLCGCAPTVQQQPHVIDLTGQGSTVAGSSPTMERAGNVESADDIQAGASGLAGKPSDDDRDGDGLLDTVDQCPDEPEDRDGFQDADGCPEPDNDADGVIDRNDLCPNEPETRNGFQDEDGCPDSTVNSAKQAYVSGARAYSQGDYATARKYFEEAFRLEPADALLFNLARTADQQGDRNGACRYYRQWRATPMGSSSTTGIASLETCP